MLFAAVVGHMVYNVARRKLEKGSSLGSLEQLIGSRTFGGTITTQLTLPGFNLLGLALLLLWLFSPLGAQSVLRILNAPLEPTFSSASAQYQDLTRATMLSNTVASSSGSAKAINVRFRHLGVKLSTLLQVPHDVQTDTMDLWGNVRIPFLPKSAVDGDDDSWTDITWSDDFERFSALAGISISSVPVGNSTLEVESAYIDLSCYNVSKGEGAGSSKNMDWDWYNFGTTPDIGRVPPTSGNGSWQGVGTNRTGDPSWDLAAAKASWAIALDRFVDNYWLNSTEQVRRRAIDPEDTGARQEFIRSYMNSPALFVNETGIEAGPTKLLFRATLDTSGHFAGDDFEAHCDVKQRYVETRVHCRRDEGRTRQNCTAVAHRPSRRDHPPDDITHLSFPSVFRHVAERLPQATNADVGVADWAIQWLNSTHVAGVTLADTLTDVDDETFGRRLAQVLNTYMLLSAHEDAQVSSDSMPNATAPVAASVLAATYRVDKTWVALAFLCCGVLLAGGVAAVVFAHGARGPEVLGFASASVRDSKLMDLPPGVGQMSGLDISRELAGVRLRYGYSDLTLQGRRLVGVGREQETTPL